MTITSILVALQLGQTNQTTLNVAASLAERYGAHAFGIAVCQPIQITYSEAYLVSDLAAQDRETRQQEMAQAETEFRDMMRGRVPSVSWHASMVTTSLATAITDHARGTDLIVAPANRNRSYLEVSNPLRVGDLIMQAGRPVLVVPNTAEKLSLDHVLVGWKDGREARRAVADSLSLLKVARRVTVAEIVPAAELPDARSRLAEVTTWLSRHGVAAEPLPLAASGEDSGRLARLAAEQGADLIVAGAYAHSRLQEWVFGGVTRHLLLHSDICAMVSH